MKTSLLLDAYGQPMMSSFEGASVIDRALATWTPRVTSPDEVYAAEGETLHARTHDITQNFGMASGAVSIHRDSIVGAQYRLNARPNAAALGLRGDRGEAWAEEAQEVIEARFNLLADSTSGWLDVSGRLTLTGITRLSIAMALMSGETLMVAEWLKDKRRPFSTAVQLISPFRLSNPMGRENTNNLRNGIEIDDYGRPIAYHIRVKMPGEITWEMDDWTWKRVEAEHPWGRKKVIHRYEAMQPAQNRGISEMAASLKDMHATRRFSDAMLQKAVLQASYAAAIETELPSETIWGAMGGVTDQGSPIAQMLGTYMQSMDKYMRGAQNIRVNEQRVPVLYPGTKFHVSPLGHPDSMGSDFEMSFLRRIASNLGLSYEQFSRDYTKTNYSSARASMAETGKYMASRKKIIADAVASDIYVLWLEEEVARGNIPLPPGYKADDWYDPVVREAISQCHWIGASRGQIDEKKETDAAVMRMAANLSTLEDECARLGTDWRQVMEQQAREMRRRRKLGLPEVNADGQAINSQTTNSNAQGQSAQGDNEEDNQDEL